MLRLLILTFACFALAACSSEPPLDPNAVVVCPSNDGEALMVQYQPHHSPTIELTADSSGATSYQRRVRTLESHDGTLLRIEPDLERVDARYEQLMKLDDGFVIYAPGLVDGEGQFLAPCTDAPENWTLYAPNNRQDGYVSFGSEDWLVDHGPFLMGATEAYSDQHRDAISIQLGQALADLEKQLGTPSGQRLHILLLERPAEATTGTVGHVTPNGVIAIINHPERIPESPERFLSTHDAILAHEAVHFWIPGPRSWEGRFISEGIAEHISFLLRETWSDSAGLALANHNRQMRNCFLIAPVHPIHFREESRPGQLDYACGALIQLTADLSIRNSSGGQQTINDLWRQLNLEFGADGFPIEVFFVRLSEFDQRAAEDLTDIWLQRRSLGERITESVDLLNRLGASATLNRMNDLDYLRAIVHGPMSDACPGDVWGFQTDDGWIEPSMARACDAGLPPGFQITHIEGLHVIREPAEIFAAVQRICENGGTIEFNGFWSSSATGLAEAGRVAPLQEIAPDAVPHRAVVPCRNNLEEPQGRPGILSLGPYFE